MGLSGFYFITDSRLSRRGIRHDVKAVLAAGISIIQYREKEKGDYQMLRQARQLRRLCRRAIFLINDRVDICLASGADGVHLGQEDFPCALARRILGKKKIIGVSVHNLRQARQAEKDGADYLGVGPIFATATKKDAGRPVGTGLIRRVKNHVRLPVFAIGGIKLHNLSRVLAAGADGACAVSAISASDQPGQEAAEFQRALAPAGGK
jgi:thiamine-phosphate pyrophosphorylase